MIWIGAMSKITEQIARRGKFLQNNEETQGYEELQSPTDVDVYKISAKEQIARGRQGKTARFYPISQEIDRGV